MSEVLAVDTIAAVATAPGRGGIGIIRVSGQRVTDVARRVLGKLPEPRQAEFFKFTNQDDEVVDEGIALYFKGPNSFTGEDVLELQGHGGPVVLDAVLQAVLACDVRLANPGEFSERAFLNDKLDLVQAEAIADLIDATSQQAAKSAVRSLQGKFSSEIHSIQEQLITTRMLLEATLDFPEEELDGFEQDVLNEIDGLYSTLTSVLSCANQGRLLREGATLVLVGKPNVGKSSLLNVLSGNESAIVTDIPGTTRDVLREHIQIEGVPFHIIDTAGLRESEDVVEQEGIRRAKQAITDADYVVLLIDSKMTESEIVSHSENLLGFIPQNLLVVQNKIDLLNEAPAIESGLNFDWVRLSAKHDLGVDALKQLLLSKIGYQTLAEDTVFIARRRHLDALSRALERVEAAKRIVSAHDPSLVAEELRAAHRALGEILGEFTPDDLLGEIFSRFCIGK